MIFCRFILTCFLLSCGVATLHGQEDVWHDSLQLELERFAHDTVRLEAILKLSKSMTADLEKARYYNEILLAEAELQGNKRYKCEAYLCQIFVAYNSYDVETLMAVMELFEPIAREEKYYDLLFRGWRCKIDMMVLTQDYELNEKEALKMLEEARVLDSQIGTLESYQCLGNIYRNTFRLKEAIEVLEKARVMALDSHQNINTVINIWQTLLILYDDFASEDGSVMHNWGRSLSQFETYLKKKSVNISEDDPVFLIIYANAVKYYRLKEDWTTVAKYSALGEELIPKIKSPLYLIYFNNSNADYYCGIGQQEKGLEAVRENVRLVKEISADGADYQNQLHREAELLYDMKRPQEALPVYRRVFELKNSFQIATINKQYEQLKSDFNAEQLLFEQGRIRLLLNICVMILLITAFLVIAYFVVYLLRTRYILKKAESEMREMALQIEQANEAKDRFLSNISTSIGEPLGEVVEGSLKLATSDFNNPVARQRLSARIRTMSNGLMVLINDILDLSRLEAGMMKYEITDVELLSLLLDAVATSECTKRETEIHSAFPENMLFMMCADRNRIQQVFGSLFTGTAHGCSGISMTLIEKDKKELHIRVAGTILAQTGATQEVIIRNEINRMIIAHFNGSYEILRDVHPPVISITLPLSEVIES